MPPDSQDTPADEVALPEAPAVAPPDLHRTLSRVTEWLRLPSLGKDIGATFAIRVGLIIMQAVVGLLITRILGPGGRGELAVTSSAGGLALQFGNLGLHAAHGYEVARHPERFAAIVANSYLAAAVMGSLCSATILLISQFTDWLPLPWPIALLVAAPVPFQLAQMHLQQLLLTQGQIRAYNGLEITGGVLVQALLIIMLLTRSTSVTATLAAGLVTVVVTCSIAACWLSPKVPLYQIDVRLLAAVLPYGLKNYLACLFAFLVMRFDLFMLDALRGPEETGVYAVAATICDMVALLPQVATSLLFPKMAAERNSRQRWRAAWRAFVILTPTLTLGGILTWLAAPPLLEILYGPRFSGAVPVLNWLLPAIVMLSLNSVFMNYFAACGFPWVAVYSPFFACLLNIAVNTWLIPPYGGKGAAIASFLAYGSMLGISGLYLCWKRPWRDMTES